MKRIAILIRTGHEFDADRRMAIERLRRANIRAFEENRDKAPGQVCHHIWIQEDEDLEAAIKILQAARISAIRA